jgi:hypothetical protein
VESTAPTVNEMRGYEELMEEDEENKEQRFKNLMILSQGRKNQWNG